MKTYLTHLLLSKSEKNLVRTLILFLFCFAFAPSAILGQNTLLLNPVQYGTVSSAGTQFPNTLSSIQESIGRRGWMKFDLNALNGATILSANLIYSTASGTVNSTATNNQLNKAPDDLSLLTGTTLYNRCALGTLTTNLYTGSWSGTHPLNLQTNGPQGGNNTVATQLVTWLQSQIPQGFACFTLKRGTGAQSYQFQMPLLSIVYLSAGCSSPPVPGFIVPLSSTPLCSGASLHLGLSGASNGPQISFQWQVSSTPGSGYVNVPTGGTSSEYVTDPMPAGIYAYRAEVSCQTPGMVSYTPDYIVNIPPPPPIVFNSPASAICHSGDSLHFTLSGGQLYTWTPNINLYFHTPDGSQVSAFPDHTTTYTVSTTDMNGCTGSIVIPVPVGRLPVAVVPQASEELICNGCSVQLSGVLPPTISSVNEPCVAVSLSGGCNGMQPFIAEVTFGAVSYASQCNPTTMYSFSGFEFEAVAGASYPLSVLNPNHSTGDQYVVWIDFNHDGVFNTNQEQFVLPSASPSMGFITIPANAYEGNARMRIRVGSSGAMYQSPCGITPVGEVEDYIIHINGGLPYQFIWSEAPGQTTLLSNSGNLVNAQGVSADQTYFLTVLSPSGCSSTQSTSVLIDSFPPTILADTGLILDCNMVTPPVFISTVLLDGKGGFWVVDSMRVRYYDSLGNLISTHFTHGTVKITPQPGGGFVVEDDGRVRIYDSSGNLMSTIFTTGTVKIITLPGGKIIVIDDGRIRLYDANGNLVSTLFTSGTVKVIIMPDGGFIVIDDGRVRRYDANGNLMSTIFTSGVVKVIPLPGGGFIVQDDGRVRLYDANGNLMSTIFTTGTVKITPLPGGGFIVEDDGRVRLYDANGNLLSTIFTNGTVHIIQLPGGKFIVEDDGRVRLYDANGNLMSTIFTTGTVKVTPLPGGGFIVEDDGRVRLYDKDGNLMSTIFTSGTIEVIQLPGGKFIVKDDGRVRLYDSTGSLMSTIFTVGAVQIIQLPGGKFIVIDDGRVRLYDSDGNLLSTIFTNGTVQIIQLPGGKFIVIDNGRVRIYDKDGNLLSTAFTSGTVTIHQLPDGRYIIQDDGRIRLYDADGNLLSTIFTNGTVTVIQLTDGGFIIIDDGRVRLYDKDGNLKSTIFTNGTSKVTPRTGGGYWVEDNDRIRYYDKDGNLISTHFTQGTRKIIPDGQGGYWIVDSNRVRWFDSNGYLKMTAFTQGEIKLHSNGTQGWILEDARSVRSYNMNGNKIGATHVASGGATAEDESRYCVLTFNDAILPGSCSQSHQLNRSWIATDPFGHSSTFVQHFYYQDTTAPVITSIPPNMVVIHPDSVPAVDLSQVIATDQCSGTLTTSWLGDSYSNVLCANQYQILRTYQVMDACMNASTAVQVIQVMDTIPPVINCIPDIFVSASSICGAMVNFEVEASDNVFKKSTLCSETSSTPTLGNCSDNGCTNKGGTCEAFDSDKDGILDECGCKKNGKFLLPVVYSMAPGSTFPIGSTAVTATATDACGNSSSCTFNVVVLSPVSLSLDQPVSCHGSQDAAIQVTVNGTGIYQFSLDGGTVSNTSGYFSGLGAGTHTVCTTEIGCSWCETITLTEPDALVMNLHVDHPAGCGLSNGQLSASVSGGTTLIQPYQLSWYNAIGTWLNPMNSSQTVMNGLSSGTYSVWAEDDHGCMSNGTVQLPDSGNCMMQLDLRLLIEGYYNGAGSMNPVLFNQGIGSSLIDCDSIEVELHDDFPPYALTQTAKAVVDVNGHATVLFTIFIGNQYIAVKHRNAIETWSATAIPIAPYYYYDFTISASQAYGANQSEVSPGLWAFFSGDINQDLNMDLIDFGLLELDAANFGSGYLPTDINGDGNVDLLDHPRLENNMEHFIYSNRP